MSSKRNTGFQKTSIGQIPSDWKVAILSTYFEVKNGKTNSQDAIEGGEYPLFDRSRNVKRSDKYLFDNEAIIVPGEGKEFLPRYYKGKFDLHQRAYAIIPISNDIDVLFYYYWIIHFNDYLSNIAVGSTVKSLRLDHLLNFPIPLPELSEQRRISTIVHKFDLKILLNEKMNKTLESIAQALFKHWFIEFEFPDENGKPYRSSGGEMVDSELGEIPKGWKIHELKELVSIIRGVSYRSADLKDSDRALVTLKSIKRGGGFNKDGYKQEAIAGISP